VELPGRQPSFYIVRPFPTAPGNVVDLLSKRELNNGFGESLARAFELALTPAIFGFLGYLLDHRIHTTPLFMLVFALWSFGYLAWKFWGDYERRMQAHEEQLGFTRRPPQEHG